jgi:signal transduction histidine kinase
MRRLMFGIIALAVLVVAVLNAQGWLVLRAASQALERELGARLQTLAITLSSGLAGRLADPASTRHLTDAVRHDELFNAFVVNESLQYLVNIREPGRTGENDPSLELDAGEILAAFSGLPGRSRLYSAGGYNLATAYAPLKDSSGAISAVLGVEADARFFSVLAGFRSSLLLINGLSLLAIAALVFISANLTRRALHIEQAAARANTLSLMGQMSGAVAHEIKNPLGIIRAAAERLQQRFDPNRRESAFGYITEEVDRLNRVLSNYLSLGVKWPAAAHADREPVDLAALVTDVAEAVKADTNVAAPLVVPGNQLELRQAFLNLLLNARQAEDEQPATKDKRPGAERGISVTGRLEQEGGRSWAVIAVADQGAGIRSEDLPRVFEPFFTTREKGSGLGLYVVRRVIEAHGGSVEIASAPGLGTTVTVRLPARATGTVRK